MAIRINLDEYADAGTHWVALFFNRNEIVYFDSFGAEHVPKEIKEFVGNKNIKANIFRVRANDSVICKYFCIGFIDLRYRVKNWLILRTCFLVMTLKKNDDLILTYFKDEWMQFCWNNWQIKLNWIDKN